MTNYLKRFISIFAPHTGAWIETNAEMKNRLWYIFAPHTGAWIETPCVQVIAHIVYSHPTRVRGLKLSMPLPFLANQFAPHTGAWIETITTPYIEMV